MADLNFQFGNRGPETNAASLASRIFLFLFATPFAAFGLFAVWGGINKVREGTASEGIFLSLFGLIFASVGLGLMYAAVTARRRQQAAEEKWLAQTDGGNKIWLARPDWAAGKIKSATGSQWKLFLFMGVMFAAIGGTASFFALKEELPKGNYAALLVLLFPTVAIGFLFATIRALLVRRRFGDCFFELAQVPAPLGGSLDGLVQTGTPLRLEEALHLKLSCIRRTVSGSGKNRNVQEDILWQDEKVFRPDASLPTTAAGGTGIPVHFNLPADQPESSVRGDSTVGWRLEAKAKMAGPDFAATFEVPVFQVARTAVAAVNEPDPTAPWQMPVEEIRRDEHSKIQVTDSPEGREFYFPAARNLGTAFGLTFFFLIWSGVVWLLFAKNAPWFFCAIFGLMDVAIAYGCFNVWFHSSRVTINPSRVRVIQRRLIFCRTREFDPGDIVRFATKNGMTSGNQVFQDIKLVTRDCESDFAARKARYQQTGERPPLKFQTTDPTGITLASSIASKPEAEWLVQQMTKALGRAAR